LIQIFSTVFPVLSLIDVDARLIGDLSQGLTDFLVERRKQFSFELRLLTPVGFPLSCEFLCQSDTGRALEREVPSQCLQAVRRLLLRAD